jgi:hypothetical protein
VRRLKLQATESSPKPRTATKHHHAAPTRQPATALEQLKEGDPWSICAVRQDRRPCQPNKPSPHQKQTQGGRGDGADHRVEIA